MDVVLILISWLILLVPGFDDSVPVTSDKIFKIETNPDMVQSITIRSDESLDFVGFDVELKQHSTGVLEIKIPKNLPSPASFTNSWHHDENPIMLTDGTEIDYDVISDPCYSRYKIHVDGETNLEILYPVILTGSWQLYSPIQFDENHSCYDKVFYEKPPLKQIKSGVKFHNVECRDELKLVYKKTDDTSACVKTTSMIELVIRGWAEDTRVLLGCLGDRIEKCYPDDPTEYRKALYDYYFGSDDNLPPSDAFDFTRLHSINVCNDKPSVCMGEFDNGTEIRIACDYHVHSCGVISFDNTTYENEN